MNRRGFLGALIGAATAELWVPKLISIPKVLRVPQVQHFGVMFKWPSGPLSTEEFYRQYVRPASICMANKLDYLINEAGVDRSRVKFYPLPIPGGVDVISQQGNLIVPPLTRFVSGYDVTTDQFLGRMDVAVRI